MKTMKKMFFKVLILVCSGLLFAGQAEETSVTSLAVGSVVELSYSDIGITDPTSKFTTFIKRNDGKTIKFNVIKPFASKTFFAELDRKLLIYNKKELRKRQLGTFLKSNPIGPMSFDNMYVKENGVEKEFAKPVQLEPPRIDSVNGTFTEDERIIFKGHFFSSIPTVYMEVQRGINFKYKKLKIDPASFKYMNAEGIPDSSCMKILATDTTDEKPVGYSEVRVKFPKITYTREAPTGYFILDNQLGMDSYMFLQTILVDDFAGPVYDTKIDEEADRKWFYTRIATDNGFFSSGKAENPMLWKFVSARIGAGLCVLSVQKNRHFIGSWLAVKHILRKNDQLNLGQVLGPYIKPVYQPEIWGVKLDIEMGIKKFKIELKELSNPDKGKEKKKLQKTVRLKSGKISVYMGIPLEKRDIDVRTLNFLVDGKGNASIDKVSFLFLHPKYRSIAEKVFLYSFGHISQCFDSKTGLVADRAKYPAVDFSAVQSTGTFALAAITAADLGYISHEDAGAITQQCKNVILNDWPSYKGVLSHFAYLESGILQPSPGSEYSIIDTLICLDSLIVACHAAGIDYADIQSRLTSGIDWEALFDTDKKQIRHGFNQNKEPLESTWDVWGAETFIVYLNYVAATGKTDFILTYSTPPTWNSSGFNDELAALLFEMIGTDIWGNNWKNYRQLAFEKQKNWLAAKIGINPLYVILQIFGLSACEVPEVWVNYPGILGFFENGYAAWGTGGRNLDMLKYADGTAVVGYPIIAPHYVAMTAVEHPQEFTNLFKVLIDDYAIFSPLTNTESFGFDLEGNLQWNSLKGSWNLSLQLLGTARLLSKEQNKEYLPYRAISEIKFLNDAYKIMMPKE